MGSIIKNYIHSTNVCSFKKFIFIQQNHIIHSRKIIHSRTLVSWTLPFIFIQQIKFPDIVAKRIQQTCPSLPQLIWNPYASFTAAIRAKMADREQMFLNCYE